MCVCCCSYVTFYKLYIMSLLLVQPVVKEESLNALETEKPKKLSVSNTLLVSNKPHPIPVEITHQLNEV